MRKLDAGREEKESPNGDQYTMAGGAKWEQHYEDILKYGCYTHQGVIYGSYKSHTVKDDNDNDMPVYKFNVCSNFEIEILQHLEDEKTPLRLVRIENVEGRRRTFECAVSVFATVGRFKECVESFGNYHFKGSARQFEQIKAYLMDNMGDGRMINVLGWQPEGFFAFNNCAVNSKVIDYDSRGCFEYEGTQYYVPSANEIYAANNTRYVAQKMMRYRESPVSFSEWTSLLVNVYGSQAYIPIIYGVVNVFGDFIYERSGGQFPLLFFYGSASTGKSTLAKAVQCLFGDPMQAMSITSKANTEKAKIRKFAQFRNIIVRLEEYRTNINTEVHEWLKGLADRFGYEMGNIESNISTTYVPIECGAIIIGNDYPAGEAFVSRLLITEFRDRDYTEADKQNYLALIDLTREGYSGFLKNIMPLRDEFTEYFPASFKLAQNEIRSLLEEENVIERIVQNSAIILATFDCLNKGLDFSFSRADLIKTLRKVIRAQAGKMNRTGDVVTWWECFLEGIRTGRIDDSLFKLDGDHLVFYFQHVYPIYQQVHFFLYHETGSDKTTLRDKIMASTGFVENASRRRIGGNQSSAMVFKISDLNSDLQDRLFDLYRVKDALYQHPTLENGQKISENGENDTPVSPNGPF